MTERGPLVVLIRCDASHALGMGHVVRCLALADELRERQGCRVVFAMRQPSVGARLVEARGFDVVLASGREVGWLDRAIESVGARALVLDVRDPLDDLPVAAVRDLRERGVVVVAVDDPSERRLAADLAFYPPVPQVQRLSWTGFDGELLVGWKWVLLRRDAVHARSARPVRTGQPSAARRLLVTMGGSDPGGLTTLALDALARTRQPFEVDLVLGPAFVEDRDFGDALARVGHPVEVHRAVRDLPALAVRADLALASFGVTAYELAVLGVPALLLCLTDDHAAAASALDAAGMARSLGRHDLLTADDLTRALAAFGADERSLREMRHRGPALLDGLGARRIAARIAERVGGGEVE